MVPDTRMNPRALFDRATEHVYRQEYADLATLLRDNTDFARERGQYLMGSMWADLNSRKRPFDYGWQLTGDQLSVLAYAKQAGAPIGQGNISVHFNYVARFQPDPDKMPDRYVISFPDLSMILPFYTSTSTIRQGESDAKPVLVAAIEELTLSGNALPKPKYALQERSPNVKRRKIKLNLVDLFTMTAEEAVRLQQGLHTNRGFL